MFPKKDRALSILDAAIKEMNLLTEMSKDIVQPDDFASSMPGLILFRACGMSLQYITESFVKIKNLCGSDYFKAYKDIPWNSVFGMRNFLSHEYGEVDAEAIFGTIKYDIPALLQTTRQMLADLPPTGED